MKIEVVDYYVKPRGKMLGTLHMYLIEDQMDLRGVAVFKTKTSYFVQPPSLLGPEGDRYGCIAFTDQDKQEDFMKSVIQAGIKFMEKREREQNE